MSNHKETDFPMWDGPPDRHKEAAGVDKTPGGALSEKLCTNSITDEQLSQQSDKSNIEKEQRIKDRQSLWDTESLLSHEFLPVLWIVQGLIPEGLTILAGASKIGKSWFLIALGYALSVGGHFLGTMKVDQIKVLYCALEDTARRLQDRLLKIGATGNKSFYLTTELKRGAEGVTELRKWLELHPDTKLIIVDTLAKFTTVRDGNSYNDVARETSGLKDLADEYGISIILVHHTKKGEESDVMQSISGSNALIGIADTSIILSRKRGSGDVTMFITGRDVEEVEYAIDFDRSLMSWKLLGERHEVQGSKTRQMVYDVIKDSDSPMTPTQVKKAVDELSGEIRSISTFKTLLKKMVDDKSLENFSGTYRVKPVDSINPIDRETITAPFETTESTEFTGLLEENTDDQPEAEELEIF